jgi:hypothetical protein
LVLLAKFICIFRIFSNSSFTNLKYQAKRLQPDLLPSTIVLKGHFLINVPYFKYKKSIAKNPTGVNTIVSGGQTTPRGYLFLAGYFFSCEKNKKYREDCQYFSLNANSKENVSELN